MLLQLNRSRVLIPCWPLRVDIEHYLMYKSHPKSHEDSFHSSRDRDVVSIFYSVYTLKSFKILFAVVVQSVVLLKVKNSEPSRPVLSMQGKTICTVSFMHNLRPSIKQRRENRRIR